MDAPAAPARAPGTGPVALVVLLVVYIALGYVLKTVVLNWVIGPLFPFLALYLVPAAWRRLRRSAP